MARVAIIGAGLAGTGAAHVLTQAGVEVEMFEKARGGGGRCSTKRHHRSRFDHGATHFIITLPEFRAQVQTWKHHNHVAQWDAYVARLPSRQPGRQHKRFVGTPGMSSLAAILGQSAAPHWRRQVNRVQRVNETWHIDGEGTFDACLVSVPAEQAVPLLEPSPEFQDLARSVTSAPTWTAMVTFEEELPVEFDAAEVEGSSLEWVVCESSKPNRSPKNCWVLRASTEWSTAHLEDQPARVADLLLTEFLKQCRVPEPEVTDLSAHRWRYARPRNPLGMGHLWNEDLKLGAAGDWCSAPGIEHAYCSGTSLGRAVLAQL